MYIQKLGLGEYLFVNREVSFLTCMLRLWEEGFREPKFSNAILDQIQHHGTVVTIVGESYRLKDQRP